MYNTYLYCIVLYCCIMYCDALACFNFPFLSAMAPQTTLALIHSPSNPDQDRSCLEENFCAFQIFMLIEQLEFVVVPEDLLMGRRPFRFKGKQVLLLYPCM